MFSGNEHGQILNEGNWLAMLQELGLHGVVVPGGAADGEPDAVVEVSRPSGATRTYAVEIRRNVPPELATALHRRGSHPTLVVTRSITQRAAELLRARGIDYIDEAGNAHIAWDDVLIDVRGRRQAGRPAGGPSARGGKAFGRAGLQVGFVLLSWPHLAAEPLRKLASVSGASLGTVKMVIDELTHAGYLYDAMGERRLGRAGELLNRWSEAYSTTLSPALSLGEFSVPDIMWWPNSEEEFLNADAQLGGEAGASLIDPHLVPTTLTLYVDQMPSELIGRHRMVRASHTAGNVHLRKRFWRNPGEPWVVSPVLIYADLLASGDPRQREHADRIRISDDRLAQLDRL